MVCVRAIRSYLNYQLDELQRFNFKSKQQLAYNLGILFKIVLTVETKHNLNLTEFKTVNLFEDLQYLDVGDKLFLDDIYNTEINIFWYEAIEYAYRKNYEIRICPISSPCRF